ncbi:MGMT family protein [uncultured Proteiniphilum sp.]|uniref:MGMT family protein n=1 Tax=uncultured Proteiniphilum sp. TaxID=497637 RepID=UPI00344D9B36
MNLWTSFQTEIWRRLLYILFGKVITYATLAGRNDHSRAAGAANGQNPIFLDCPLSQGGLHKR